MEESNSRSLLADGGVIVISILLAFAIEAWWESRQEDEAAHWLIQRLVSDFEKIRADLDVAMADHQRAMDAIVSLGEHRGEFEATADTRRQLFDVFVGFRTFNPGAGSVEVFLNSDASRMIENRPLADLLIRWPSVLEEMREDEAQLPDGVHNRWRPFLASRMDLRLLYGLDSPVESATIEADAEFFNHLMDRYMIQQVIVRDMEPVSETVDAILAIVSREVEQ